MHSRVVESKNKKPKQNETADKPQHRILMLHGYRQNEMAFRERSGGLRKALKNYVSEFVFCEAPHLIPSEASQVENTTNERGWWFSSNSSYNALEHTNCHNGFEESLDYIDKIFEQKGPFDGILGFSQGACLASMLCKISSDDNSKYKNIRFKFAIIIAGFRSNQSQHDVFYDLNNKIQKSTLHIFGKEDKVIPFDMANKLVDYFESPKVFHHEAGHLIPVNADSKSVLFEFLSEMAKNK